MSGSYEVHTRSNKGNRAEWYIPLPEEAEDTVATAANVLIAAAMSKLGIVIDRLVREGDFNRLMPEVEAVVKRIAD